MKRAYSVEAVANRLGSTPAVARALIEAIFGAPRDLVSHEEVEQLVEAHRLGAWGRPSAPGAPPDPAGGVPGPLGTRWVANTGQGLLDLGGAPARGAPWRHPLRRGEAERYFSTGVQLEESEPEAALAAYGDALAADPLHADAHVNRGRLLHQRGALTEAEAHYVAALVSRPDDLTARFNLAVVLDDLGRVDVAIVAYRAALERDPACVDAYFNLARLYERKGEKVAAFRHLKDYRRLTGREPR
jgi:tetratricopeptide (TPR) repeat protein